MNDIVINVAKTFDCTAEHLRSSKREFTIARDVATFIAFEDGLYLQSEIATALAVGGRSTVSAMIRRCRDSLAAHPDLSALVAGCRAIIPRVPVRTSVHAAARTSGSEPACFRPVPS
jgi:chromosomal replication initiation ATPase DnaA